MIVFHAPNLLISLKKQGGGGEEEEFAAELAVIKAEIAALRADLAQPSPRPSAEELTRQDSLADLKEEEERLLEKLGRLEEAKGANKATDTGEPDFQMDEDLRERALAAMADAAGGQSEEDEKTVEAAGEVLGEAVRKHAEELSEGDDPEAHTANEISWAYKLMMLAMMAAPILVYAYHRSGSPDSDEDGSSLAENIELDVGHAIEYFSSYARDNLGFMGKCTVEQMEIIREQIVDQSLMEDNSSVWQKIDQAISHFSPYESGTDAAYEVMARTGMHQPLARPPPTGETISNIMSYVTPYEGESEWKRQWREDRGLNINKVSEGFATFRQYPEAYPEKSAQGTAAGVFEPLGGESYGAPEDICNELDQNAWNVGAAMLAATGMAGSIAYAKTASTVAALPCVLKATANLAKSIFSSEKEEKTKAGTKSKVTSSAGRIHRKKSLKKTKKKSKKKSIKKTKKKLKKKSIKKKKKSKKNTIKRKR